MKRFNSHFAFKIPENISSVEAAPLLCAGATVYSPLKRYGCSKGMKVGVIGIGGLGHLAVQFAAKMGAEVVAIGHSASKAELAKQLGATEYITLDDEAALKKYKGTLNTVIATANAKDMPWQKYFSLCALDAHFVLVGAPEEELKVQPFTLIGSRVNLVGSMIGSIDEIKSMLEFASKNDVRPMVEVLPMSEVNEGIRKVKENDVKFRVVLEAGK
jgi:alcohol dehydrogenase (NADP+)